MQTLFRQLLALAKGGPFTVFRAHDSVSRARHRMLYDAFLYTRNESVEGCYMEFGIAAGRSLVYTWDILSRLGIREQVPLLAYDAFQGFPEPKGVDARFVRFRKGDAAHSRATVEHNLRRHGVPADRVTLVDGWYKDTLTAGARQALNPGPVRVLNIDCDLYDSTRLALEYIEPLLVDGAVILFDDWYCYRGNPERGEQRAATEWLARHPHWRLVPWKPYANVGQSFIASRRATDPDPA